MKRLDLRPLLLISACLTACSAPSSPDESRQFLMNATIGFGAKEAVTLDLPAGYAWRALTTPPWLRIDRTDTPDRLTLRVDRDRVADHATRQANVQGTVDMYWAASDGRSSGKAKWDVSFSFYRVSGTISPQSSGQDVQLQRRPDVPDTGPADSRILSFGSVADADAFVRAARGSSDVQALTALRLRGASFSRLGPSSVVMDGPTLDGHERAALSAAFGGITVTANAALHELGDPVTALPMEPADPFYANQWAFRTLGYPAVWRDMESGTYTHSAVIAVIDSGVRYDHPDLGAALLTGIEGAVDLLPAGMSDDGDGPDTDPTDPDFFGRTRGSHGTHVAGIMAAGWNRFEAPCGACSDRGVAGAAYRAPVRLLPVRAIDARGQSDVATVTSAVLYAAGIPTEVEGRVYANPNPAQVINLSLGGPMDEQTAAPLCGAIHAARERGTAVIAAAGNTGDERVHYPAACPDAVAVGAVTLTHGGQVAHSSFSSHYSAVRLSAPGGGASDLASGKTYFNGSRFNDAPFPDDILSTDWDYERDLPVYSTMIGTSQATPQVSVLTALLLAKGVTGSAVQATERIEQTATDLGTPGRDPFYGFGMINPRAALNAPAISSGYGVAFRRDDGNVYTAEVRTDGAFEAFLPSGTFDLTAGEDRNGNGLYGESGEAGVRQRVRLGADAPELKLGELRLTPGR